ncbi:MAG: hypothetical protein ACREPX_09195 [Rhodanobacteraceae bacterium]
MLALAALGSLKLAQVTLARAQFERLSANLAPSLQLTYSGVTGALDGRVLLDRPRLEVLSGPARGAVVQARRATIEPSGTFWLLQRAISGDAGAPPTLNVRLEGTTLSQPDLDRFSEEGWFGRTSLVPFDSVGCGTRAAFSERDYARMGLAIRPREDEIRYAYDAAAHTMRADIVSTAAPFSTITTHLELSQFEPAAWFGDARAMKSQRVEQFALTYLDGGYLDKRNRFCAQLTGTNASNYAAHHLAEVDAFLEERGVVAGDEVENLYRKLVTEGGSAELSSLPESAFVPADFAAYPPDDLLRQLNVTLRRNTAQPILLRLGFAEPIPTVPSLLEIPTYETGLVESSSAVLTPPVETIEPAQQAPVEVRSVPTSSKTDLLPLLSVANAATVPIESAPASTPSLPVPGDDDLAEAPAEPASPWTTVQHPSVDPRNAVEAIPASAPPPAADSTAALVWRAPTIERLPEKTVATSGYVSIPAASLGAYRGARVRLITAGGKIVDGRVQQVEGADVVVQIRRDGGVAQVRIPQSGIRTAQIRRATP